MDFSEETKCSIDVLSEAMKSVFYMFQVDFLDLEELHETGNEGKPSESVDFQLCDNPYNVTCQGELEITG